MVYLKKTIISYRNPYLLWFFWSLAPTHHLDPRMIHHPILQNNANTIIDHSDMIKTTSGLSLVSASSLILM